MRVRSLPASPIPGHRGGTVVSDAGRRAVGRTGLLAGRIPGLAGAARLEVATGVGGVALALLVGRDGTPGWRVARMAGALVFTAVAVIAESRAGGRWRGLIAAVVGMAWLAVGLGFLPYLVKDGPSLVALGGLVLAATGAALVVAGTAVAGRRRRLVGRVATGAAVLLATVVVAYVVGVSVAATNVPRPAIGATPDRVGMTYESVHLTTDDGVRLAAWYVPSANRAAVVLLHGAGSTRSDVLPQAAVLARNGYGVLLVDARGHGQSGGRAMDFGWSGDADIAAATAFLVRRDDVDPARIGLVGMSMGGEEAIGATAHNRLVRAVVAEGATARSAGDDAWLSEEYGARGALQEVIEHAQDRVTDLLTSAGPPVSNREAVAASGDTRYLLVTAGDVPMEAHAAAYVAGADPERVDVWTVPGAGHTDGLATAPADWERRVVALLDDALDVGAGSPTPPADAG